MDRGGGAGRGTASARTCVKAAKASLTLQQLIAESQAHGLCVGTCMGWLPRGFPCLGFSRLNDARHSRRVRRRCGLRADDARCSSTR